VRHASAYEVRNLRKVYDGPEVVANDAITFSAEPGEAFGLLGPNGAGKSTLVKQLVGLLTPTAGEVRLFGEVVKAEPSRDRRIGRTVAYLPQGALALGELRVAEAIRWTGMLRGLGRPTAETEMEELLDELQLVGLADRQIRKLSGGQRRLVQIGMTLVGRLPVLILDEPTSSLDPKQRVEVRDLIARLRGEHTVILSTHILPEVSQITDRVVIINRGKVMAVDTPDTLSQRLRGREEITVEVAGGDAASIRQAVSSIPGVARVDVNEAGADLVRARIHSDLGTDVRADVARLLASQWRLLGLRSESLSLEEIFLKLTADRSEEPDGGPARPALQEHD
jgi:ABC-2 type transport system ATP-binding protein